MSRSSSKSAPQTKATDGGGNASVAIRALAELRTSGFEPTSITVGDVTIALVPRLGGATGLPTQPRRSIVEEYGGAAIAKVLGDAVEADENGLVPA